MGFEDLRSIISNRDLTLRDAMQCLLDLRPIEIEAYFALREGSKDVKSLAESINRNRSSAQRILQNLVSKGLAYRKSLSKDEGGYYYKYYASPEEGIKKKMKENLEDMYKRMSELLE
ncbi:MAG: helix-turn-helix domain-containing protein [Candidatus Hydrothermarchaeota archaeon]